MKYTAYQEQRFRESVNNALKEVKTILDSSLHPRLAEDVDHVYNDKYVLAEFLTNVSFASEWQVFDAMGLDHEKRKTVASWVSSDRLNVRLRFQAHDSCSLLKTQDVEVVRQGNQYETTTESTTTASSGSGFFATGKTEQTTSRMVTRVKENHWKVDLGYKIIIFAGSDPAEKSLELQSRSTSTILVTSGGLNAHPNLRKTDAPPPIAAKTFHPAIDTNVTWLFQQLLSSEEGVCKFNIDRNANTCKTPRRNKDIAAACKFNKHLNYWGKHVVEFFLLRVERDILNKHAPVKQTDTGPGALSLSNISSKEVFCPALPLLDENSKSLLPIGDLLEEQKRSLEEANSKLAAIYPPHQLAKAVTIAEAKLFLLCCHLSDLAVQYMDGVDYIENLLKTQLVQAIGRQVNGKEFDDFMRFHGKRLLGPNYAPKQFCYAIRRPDHYPDGMLSIESGGNRSQPIETMVKHIPSGKRKVGNDNVLCPPIFVPINAATSLEISGDRYLHGWIQHRFENEPKPDYQLVARARQFSSFLLVVGTMAGANSFEPKHAIILQNKAEVMIPLEISTLPSAKEFKDSISSLSPEQQEFCKAFREMQLESSVFGVYVIQLKPQLEKLLGLPDGALTKEIQLTQDLMSLFVDYQIPSDLLSFDGPEEADQITKIEKVRNHVKSVMNVIESAKEKQLIEEERKTDMRVEMATDTRAYFEALPQQDERLAVLPSLSQNQQMMMSQMMQPVGQAPASAGHSKERRREQKRSAAPSQEVKVSPQEAAPPSQKGKSEDMKAPSLSSGEDFTLIPKVLDSKLEMYDTDGSLCSTIIKAATSWTTRQQQNLLTPPKLSMMTSSNIDSEKKKAFDLLDALSRSGSLPIDCAELHVVIALSHCFDNDVMGTIIEDNINPIEKVEKSKLIVASTIHGVGPQVLLNDPLKCQQLEKRFPLLFHSQTSEFDSETATQM